MLCLECADQLVAEHPDVFEAVKRFWPTARSVTSRRGFQTRRLTVGRSFQVGRTLGLPAVPVRELLDRLTIRGLEILSMRIRHCDHRSLLYLGVIYAQDRRHLFLELDASRLKPVHARVPRA